MHNTVKLVIISMFELVYIAFVTVRGIGTPGSDWTSTPKSTSSFCGATAPLFGGLNPYNLQYIKTIYSSTQYHLHVGLGVIPSVRGEGSA
jgi:hypothetical protein